jgi:predicted GNAT superfamily acetyltransferase
MPAVELARLEMARSEASAAARAARVRISDVTTIGEARLLARFAGEIWQSAADPPSDLYRALSYAGGTALLARSSKDIPADVAATASITDEEDGPCASIESLCGIAIGFLGWEGGCHLHSHQVAVAPRARRRGVALALKLAQRLRCLEHGVATMEWTFDPLLCANAQFNFARLGVTGVGYLPDFYGAMEDGINESDRSDRMLVSWDLTAVADLDLPLGEVQAESAATGTAATGTAATGTAATGSDPLLVVDDKGWPRRGGGRLCDGASIEIPESYAELRRARDRRAVAWREASGEVFAEAFSVGLLATSFSSRRYLLSDRDSARQSARTRAGQTGIHEQEMR